MVVTRSQVGADDGRKIFEEPPRSPSAHTIDHPTTSREADRDRRGVHQRAPPPAPLAGPSALATTVATSVTAIQPQTTEVHTTPMQRISTEANQREAMRRTALNTQQEVDTQSECSRPRSRRSTATAIARLQYEAEERIAEIKRKELQLEAELVKKKLAADIAALEDDQSLPDEPTEQITERVTAWLEDHPPPTDTARGESAEVTTLSHRRQEVEKGVTAPPLVNTHAPPAEREQRRNIAWETPRREYRERSPTPARYKGRGAEQLAEVLRDIAIQRPPSRVSPELPIFSGNPAEWLPFRAAVRDTATSFKFSPEENLTKLRSSLRGEARELVSTLLYTAKDPNQIIATLDQYYGRPETLVEQALQEIRRLPHPGTSASELNKFAIKLQNTVALLMNIDKKGYLYNPMLAREVIEKLSPHVRARWADYAEVNYAPGQPEIVMLSRFLMREAEKAIRFTYSPSTPAAATTKKETRPAKNAAEKKKQSNRASVYATNSEDKELKEKDDRVCICCNGKHYLTECEEFKKKEVNERWEVVRKKRLCFKCIKSSHRRSSCKSKNCDTNGCNKPHHPLLHSEYKERNQDEDKPSTSDEAVHVTSDVSKQKATVLLKVCPVTISGNMGEVHTYALMDEGSTISLIDSKIAQAVTDEEEASPFTMHGVGMSQQLSASKRVKIKIKGRDETQYHDFTARTVQDLELKPQTISQDIKKYEHLRDLGGACYNNAKPRVLIGADHWHLIVSQELRRGTRQEPAASRTDLGWVIFGTIPRAILTKQEDTVLHITSSQVRDIEEHNRRLEDLIKSHYEIDALGVSTAIKMKPEEERAVQIFEKTVRRVNGRMEVGLPWKHDDIEMPPSHKEAFRRLKNIEKRMDRDEAFKEQYTAQVDNLLRKGYAEPCHNEPENSIKWYLPHFGVCNPNKPGKLRLVFDAAGRASGKCLNDYLLEGPDRLRSLQGILFRFREKPIAVTADIEEMFLQIKIMKEDQSALMFLWRGEDRKHPPQRFKMTSLIFGACCSPFIAHSARDKNASEFQEIYPEATRAICENHYMDDYLDSFDSEKEASERANEIIYIHSQASFNLRGWNSNSPEVLNNLPQEKLSKTASVSIGARPDQMDKTLGLRWDPLEDKLGFTTKMPRVPEEVRKQERTPTKREALSAVMSVYDPLGLISQYMITAKIILQRLWKKNTGWDENLPEEEAEDFARWLKMVDSVTQLRLPRAYALDTTRNTEYELHVFCDASEQAYATAAYWRMKHEDGRIHVALVAAKARVAPLKTQTIPRLELQAAVIGVRLAETIKKEHRIQARRVIYWTDSSTVIHWIRGNEKRNTPFVAHRLGEIAQCTEPEDWRWLPTYLNVADDATRRNFTRPSDTTRWYNGPAFLYEEEEEWPSGFNSEFIEVSKEEQVGHLDEKYDRALPDPKKSSSYTRLINVTARMLLFIEKLRKRDRTIQLEVRHLESAERLQIRDSQIESFSDEIKKLNKNKPLPKSSRLYRVDAEIVDGILRVRGRIGAAQVASDTKNPIILDSRHPFTKLLLRREHYNAQHANNERVINEVRQRYYVLSLRTAVRTVARTCPVCRVYRSQPSRPVRGDLPQARLDAYQRPFTNCGVDFFGPMVIKIGRRREKRWGALFTCLVTRAVHIELVPSLSTDSAIMALRRMAARRGWPRVMWSDNATNFRGADRELQNAYKEWLAPLKEYGLTQRLDWRYIAPGAPHQGGAWERLVRSIKTTLHAILKEKVPSEEVLQTLLCEAEHAVNSRPLTHVPVDPREPQALTPNHFLIGTSSGLPMTGPIDKNEKRIWRTTQALADEYWRRWIKEYLPTLVPRGQADDHAKPVREGDLVIIADASLPRNTWPRGVVEKVIPGADGKVRQVDVRTKGGVFRRPVSRLVVLDIEASS